MVTKRGKNYYLRIRPFGGKEIGVKTSARTKTEAKQIEMAVVTACRAGDYSGLDPASREVCLRLFQNQGLEMPAGLEVSGPVQEELTLWKAIKLCIEYPEVYNSPNRERLEQCFFHLVEKWGQDFPVKSIRVPHIRLYRVDRLKEGAAPGTVNREKSALSKMFQIRMEHELVDRNPARDVRNLSEKSGERQVYIGFDDIQKVLMALPGWYRAFVQTAYYTGMRRGEALWLRWDQVDLKNRIIKLGWDQTKERRPKRVPIHKTLVQILADVKEERFSLSDGVFLNDEGYPPYEDSLTRAWRRAVKALNFDPRLTVHDLRHCWKTNAMRSGVHRVHPVIADMIVGHGNRKKDVQSLYLTVSDAVLVAAIDRMKFDKGETEIWVSERGNGRLFQG